MKDESETKGRFWTKEVQGHPVWFWASMAVVPLYMGLLVAQLGFGDVAALAGFGVLLAGGMYFLVAGLWRRS